MSVALSPRRLRTIAFMTTTLIVTIIGAATFIGMEVQKTFHALEKDWQRFQNTSELKVKYRHQIEFALGYDGFIYHYKNMLQLYRIFF